LTLRKRQALTSSYLIRGRRQSGDPWIVPIPGTRHLSRLKENAWAVDIHLSIEELWGIDTELDSMVMSDVFGGSTIKQ